MRTGLDRLRHTIFFEAFALIISIPIASVVMNRELVQTGVLGISLSMWAMVWNAVYNYLFDLMLIKFNRPLDQRPPKLRLFHSFLFEVGILLPTLPFVAWWMDLSLWQAFLMDLGFSLFFMGYAYVFNWTYDRVFPYPVSASTAEAKA